MKSAFCLCLLFLAVLFVGSNTAIGAETKGEAFVGSEACQGCHEAQVASLMRSPHWKKSVKDSPVNRNGCESCHGPGAAHVEKGGGKYPGGMTTFAKTESARAKADKCLSCHEQGRQVAFWDSGAHKKNDVSCSDCHSTHKVNKFGKDNLRTADHEVCGKCHKDVKMQIQRRSRHPILEGKVSCSSCHEPHGSMGPKMIKADVDPDLCYKCHAEKRAPLRFEHPPVKESCLSCHAPHGSVRNRLLTEKVPNLCQACHHATGHPGEPHTAQNAFGSPNASRFFFGRSCLNCHFNIHGSNASPIFIR